MAWLATPEGQRDVYRRDEHVLPSQFADRAAWDAYLDGLRQHKPATFDDVRPRLAGVNLVAEIDTDIVDPIRVYMSLARSAGRRIGQECVSSCIDRWTPYNNKQQS